MMEHSPEAAYQQAGKPGADQYLFLAVLVEANGGGSRIREKAGKKKKKHADKVSFLKDRIQPNGGRKEEAGEVCNKEP